MQRTLFVIALLVGVSFPSTLIAQEHNGTEDPEQPEQVFLRRAASDYAQKARAKTRERGHLLSQVPDEIANEYRERVSHLNREYQERLEQLHGETVTVTYGLPAPKAGALAEMLKQHIPFDVDMNVSPPRNSGRVILTVTTRRDVILSLNPFVDLLVGRTQLDSEIEEFEPAATVPMTSN